MRVSVTRAMTECMLVLRAKESQVMNEPHARPTGAKAKLMCGVKSTPSQSYFFAPFLFGAEFSGKD